MPYRIRKRGKAWAVVNVSTGKVKARHTTRRKAERQLRLLRSVERTSR